MNAGVVVERLRSWDPDGAVARRSARAGIAVPAVLGVAMIVFGPGQLSVFAAFAAIALLMFADFPGTRSARTADYASLALVGAVAVAVATLASRPAWVAVLAMAVVGTLVLFGGVLSATVAGGSRAVLLAWVWALLLPGGPDEIPARLAGWGLAVVICVPVAVLLWPPRVRRDLHVHSAASCRALAELLRSRVLGTDQGADAEVPASAALDGLRRIFRGVEVRPVGLGAGSRALIRLVDEMERLGDVIGSSAVRDAHGWPEPARGVAAATACVLEAVARALEAGSEDRAAALQGLDEALDDLVHARAAVFAEAEAALRHGGVALPPYQAHELAQAALMTGDVVGSAVAADARSLRDRLLGRRPTGRALDRLSSPGRIVAGHLDRHSVWLHNSLRGGAGLGLAVLIAELAEPQHAFWVVLAAMSVLRSTGRSTRATAARAVGGTVAGFVVGGAVVFLVGSDPLAMWVLLVLAVAAATFGSGAGSFVGGQAGLTVALVVLFNIVGPAGWQVGLVRVEDVAIGCGAGVVAGLLLWPRGAEVEIGRALARSYRAGAEYLLAAVAHATGRAPEPSSELAEARAAAHRSDDALRQYLGERGPRDASLADLTAVIGGASQLRLVGFAIVAQSTDRGARRFAEADVLVLRRVRELHAWFAAAADVLDGHRIPGPPPEEPEHEEVLDALCRDLAEGGGTGEDVADARRLLWTALFLRDVRNLADRVAGPVTALRATPPDDTRAVSRPTDRTSERAP